VYCILKNKTDFKLGEFFKVVEYFGLAAEISCFNFSTLPICLGLARPGSLPVDT
jgi:hypothetical protein